MAPTSSIGVPLRKAVTDQFGEYLGTLSDFNGSGQAERKTQVTFGYRFGNRAREQVYTGRSRSDTPPAGMRSGRNTRQETGTFDLVVMVRVPNPADEDAEYAAEVRASEIGGEFESWVADRKNAEVDVDGSIGLQTLVVTAVATDYQKVDGGAAAVRQYTVRWTARLE